MIKNKVFYLNRAIRINVFKANNGRCEYGLCVEIGSGQQYKSFWITLSRYSFQIINDISSFFHIQGLFVAISLSY